MVNDKAVGSVGYHVRFNRCVSDQTQLEFVTDGMLIAQIRDDPTLSKVTTIVFDEVHELSVPTELVLAIAKFVCAHQPDRLKLVVMSATLPRRSTWTTFLAL